MTDYVLAMLYLYPTAQFTANGDEYEGIEWAASNPTPKPTKAALEAVWPTVLASYQNAASNKTTLQNKAAAALATNDAFLALASPNASQQAAQLKVVTRECSALIRLLLQKYDSTAGT